MTPYLLKSLKQFAGINIFYHYNLWHKPNDFTTFSTLIKK